MKRLLVLLVSCVGLAGQAYAQGEETPDRFTLMKQAVKYATKADSYSAYCSDEPSSMASNYLDSFFLEAGVTIAQKDELASIMEKEVQSFLARLKEDKPSCSDLEFMMGRLEIMRKLKDVSYLLNGVDPATLPPDNIPNLEDLMLPRNEDMPIPVEH